MRDRAGKSSSPKLHDAKTTMLSEPNDGAYLHECARLHPELTARLFGLVLLSGLRRGELFALRWRDFDERDQHLHVREAVYDAAFSTPKTAARVRQIPPA